MPGNSLKGSISEADFSSEVAEEAVTPPTLAEPSPAAAGEAVSPHIFDYGANQSAKRFTLRSKLKADWKPGKNKLESLSEGGYLEVRSPRSFAAEQDVQLGRHLATTLGHYLEAKGVDYREVQVAFDKKKVEIWISTNTHKGNEALIDSGIKELKNVPKLSLQGAEDIRVKRHTEKLISRITNNRYPEYAAYKLRVLGKDKFADGDHAERVLVDKHDVDGNRFDLIAGIKRPCAHCAAYLEDKGYTIHSVGPAWLSQASSREGKLKPSSKPTAVTLTTGEKYTFEHGTDSDTDTEGKKLSLGKPKRGKKRQREDSDNNS